MKHTRWITVALAVALVAGAAFLAWAGSSALAQGDAGPGVVIFSSNRSGNFEIYGLDPDTGLLTQLTNDPGADIEPVVSPDGAFIAFVSNRDGDYELYIMRANGTDIRQITNNNAEDRQPRWQPNGTHVVFVSDVNGQWDLYVVTADGAVVRQLTNDAFDERGPVSDVVGVPPGTGGDPAPVVTATPAAAQADGVVSSAFSSINVRSNPGTGAPVIATLTRNTPVDVIGRLQDSSWLQIQLLDGQVGWVAANLIQLNINLTSLPVVNAVFIAPTPTYTPSPTYTPTPEVIIEFYADRYTIPEGECVTIFWRVQGIKEVYYKGIGVVGQGSAEECPTETTTYTLRVILQDDTEVQRQVTITVEAP